jgi:hypothetical protein
MSQRPWSHRKSDDTIAVRDIDSNQAYVYDKKVFDGAKRDVIDSRDKPKR